MYLEDLPFGDSLVYVPLSQGQHAIIDGRDAHLVLPFKWSADKRVQKDGTVVYYAYRFDWSTGKPRKAYLHRIIAGAQLGEMIDHEDGDPLNCRRGNIRSATHSQNGANRRKRTPRSPFKGVVRAPRPGVWLAYITHPGGKRRYLGTFTSPEVAAIVFDCAARAYHGEYARLNFPFMKAEGSS